VKAAALRAAPLLLALAPAACAGGCDEPGSKPASSSSDPLPSDPIARAIALRDRVPQGVAAWPMETTMLAEDRVFDRAVQRGGDLYAVAKEEIVRVPTAGGPATTLAKFPGRETRGLAVTARHLIVETFEVSRDGVGVKSGTGSLVALALDGPEAGAQIEMRRGFGASTEMAAADDGVYFGEDVAAAPILFFPAPAFAKPVQIALRGPHVMFWGMVAESDGVEWLEETFSPTTKTLAGWTRGAADASAPVRAISHENGFGYTMRSDGHAVYMVVTTSRSATAPGGGTYYEDSGGVVAIDRATGASTTIAKDLENPGDIAVGPQWVCVTVYGPKLEFSKNSTLYAVPKAGGEPRRLATGLLRPSCLAADDRFFYVSEQSKKGIARVAVPAGAP
jgi:hypothetical protein